MSTDKFKLEPGINKCTNTEYHSDKDYLSSSSFKTLLKSPLQFHEQYIQGIVQEQKISGALSLGSYTHSRILEPNLVDEEYYMFDGASRNSAAYRTALLYAKEIDKVLITTKEHEMANAMVKVYNSRKEATDLLADGEPEKTLCTELSGIDVKVRGDWVNVEAGYIVDIKTTSSPTDIYSFKETCDRYDYYLSAALYTAAFERHYKRGFDFYFIPLGKFTNTCDVYKIGKETMKIARERLDTAFWQYKTKLKNDSWFDYEIAEL